MSIRNMKYEIKNSYATTHFSGEDESKLILSFLKSSSGRPTMSDIGDLEHSAPGDHGDFEKSRAPPGDRGDLALGDLWAGTALGWPGIGFPSPTITSSCDCCQQAWKDPSQSSAILIFNKAGIRNSPRSHLHPSAQSLCRI